MFSRLKDIPAVGLGVRGRTHVEVALVVVGSLADRSWATVRGVFDAWIGLIYALDLSCFVQV